MKLASRKFLHRAVVVAVLGALVGAFSDGAWSQSRTVKVVVTFPQRAGGDLMTRAVADQVSRSRDTSVVELVEHPHVP